MGRAVGVAFRSGLNEQNVVSSRPGRPPKRTSVPLVPISQHGGQFLSMKKHRLENGDYDYPHHHGHHNPAGKLINLNSPFFLLTHSLSHSPFFGFITNTQPILLMYYAQSPPVSIFTSATRWLLLIHEKTRVFQPLSHQTVESVMMHSAFHNVEQTQHYHSCFAILYVHIYHHPFPTSRVHGFTLIRRK